MKGVVTIDGDASQNVLVVDFSPGVLKGDPRPEAASMLASNGPSVEFALEGKCRHLNIDVCEDKAEVTCRDCGEKLNPIWVLMRMAKEETKWAYRRSQFIEARAELEKRQRCKCQHCGNMTRIKV